MEFVTITPTKFMLDALNTSGWTLVLAHKIEKGNAYQRACLNFKEHGGKIIMDNSYYELRPDNFSTEELVRRAKLINADVITLQDAPLAANTKWQTQRIIKDMKKLGFNGKFLRCVFADNKSFKEDVEQFRLLNLVPELDIIAIPYTFDKRKKDEFRRPELLDMIEKQIGKGEITKHVHLFGCNNFYNLTNGKENRSWIKTIDGTMPWKCGYLKKNLPLKPSEEPERPKNYFDIDSVDIERRKVIDTNLKLIKEVCEHG